MKDMFLGRFLGFRFGNKQALRPFQPSVDDDALCSISCPLIKNCPQTIVAPLWGKSPLCLTDGQTEA